MCTGVELALLSAATTAAGSYMQYDSQQSKADAQRKAANAEALRQGQIDQDKNARWQNSLVDFERDTQQGNIDDATAEREQLMREVVARPEDGDGSFESATAGNAPRVVQDYADDRQAEADDFVGLLGNARARLGAWGESRFAPAESLSELGFDMQELNTQAGRSGAIGAQEAQNAYQDAGNGMALAGNVVSGLGQAGMGMAGGQMAPGSPAHYQGAGFAGGVGSFADRYRAADLGRNFYNGGGGLY